MKQHHRLGILAMVLAPVVGLLLGLGVSPAIRIDRITVRAPDASLGEEVRRSLQVPAEASMLFYPLPRIAEQVRQCYRVDKVSVDRTSPHELLVTVTTRAPFIALEDGNGYTIASRDGVCLYRQTGAPASLPRVAGLCSPRPPLGSRLDAERMQWVVDLMSGAAKVGLREGARYDLSSLHRITFSSPDGLQGQLGNVNNLSRKMTIVGRIAEQLRQQGRTPTAIDVSVPESPIWTVRG